MVRFSKGHDCSVRVARRGGRERLLPPRKWPEISTRSFYSPDRSPFGGRRSYRCAARRATCRRECRWLRPHYRTSFEAAACKASPGLARTRTPRRERERVRRTERDQAYVLYWRRESGCKQAPDTLFPRDRPITRPNFRIEEPKTTTTPP